MPPRVNAANTIQSDVAHANLPIAMERRHSQRSTVYDRDCVSRGKGLMKRQARI